MFMKFQNREKAFNKLTKDVEFTKSELKREEERTSKFPDQQLVHLQYTLKIMYTLFMNLLIVLVCYVSNCVKGIWLQ